MLLVASHKLQQHHCFVAVLAQIPRKHKHGKHEEKMSTAFSSMK